jgi:hypothetical protein
MTSPATATPQISFKGLCILCFYSTGLFQGHCIDKVNNKSTYSLAGKILPDHVDPLHNDCMEPDDFYQVLIQSHVSNTSQALLLRRSKNNDAAGLFTHENEQEQNDGYHFLFETHQFLSGEKAQALKEKYFPRGEEDPHLTVCIGDIGFYQQEQEKKQEQA